MGAKAETSDATKKAEETAAGSKAAGGEAASGRGVSVPDGVPNGGVFLGGNGGFYRNVDGVARPISDAEAAKILNQINQSNGEANGGLNSQVNGQGDNLNDNSNGGKPVSLGYENAPVVEMPLDKLKLSADVPNFKEGADENGVVSGQRLQGKYERVGTAPIVVWERENGDTEVITGRHRLDLARRSGEKSIPAYVVREADGFTVDDARTFDAESNIRDGMGTVRDYAHFFRNKDIDEAEASGKGLLSREKGKRGWAIGKFAEDNLYWLYRNGGISEERAAAIARGAPNDADVQNAALDSAKGMDATTLEIHTRRLKAFKDEGGGNATGEAVQGDLFGVDDAAMREMVALSKAAGELVKQNKQRILAVKGVIKRPEIAREMGVDINNPDAVRAAVAALEYENSRLMSPTPEPEIMDKIRRKAGLFDKAENGENVEQGAESEAQEDTGGVFDDGTAEMSFKKPFKVRYDNLDEFLTKGIQSGRSTFYDFGELSPETVKRIREKTNLDLSGYVHTLENYGVVHGEKKHSGKSEVLRGQVPITRDDWKKANDIVNNFDDVSLMATLSKNGNQVLEFKKQIDGEVYHVSYLTEIRAGRKKLVCATMWKQKNGATSTGISSYEDKRNPSRPKRLRSQPLSGNAQSENTSESQGKNAENNFKASFGAKDRRAEIEKNNRYFRELYERYKNGDQAAYEEAAKMVVDYAKSKGYDVKVYHGTGADGFNVADATTRNQKFGEGNQAHGKGLYIAMTPETAERYRRAGRKTESIVVGGKNPEEFGITPENIGINSGRIGDLLRRMYPHGSEFLLSDIKEQIARQKDVLTRYKARLENLRPPDTKGSLEMGIRMSESLIVSYEKEYAAAKKIDSILKKHNVSVEMRRGRGKVFEWFTNLKPSEVIDEGKTLSEQPDVLKKLEEIWDKVLYPVVDEELKNGSSDAAYVQRYKPTGYLLGEAVIDGWSNYLGKTSFNDLMLEHGIRGITYDGHIDGRCYVSFEGGSTVKLQDPFTFDDNGELIPLSERFDEGNPDMRYSRGASGKASNGGKVGGGVSFESMVEEYAKLRELREKTVGEKPLTFIRPVSAMRSALPKSVRFNKASNRLEGVPSIGDIRRYMERVFNVPISNGLRKEVRQRGALGVYYNRLEAIRTLRGHVNDLDTVAHELGHYLETLFFGGKLASEEVKDFALAKELEGYCVERFGEFTYKGRERISEGWAQFISDVIKGDEIVADRCPRAFSALSSALRESPRVNEAFSFICQMAELNANASPLQRVNANIRRRSDAVRKTAVDRLIESGRWFTRMWFDEYEGLERFQKDLERSGVSEEDGSRVIDLARNYAGGSVGQVNYSLTVNQIDLDGRVVGKSLRSILRDNLKTAYDKENIDAYLMCRRVVEYYKTEERRGERGGSRSKFGIDYADAVDVVSTATDGMRKCGFVCVVVSVLINFAFRVFLLDF